MLLQLKRSAGWMLMVNSINSPRWLRYFAAHPQAGAGGFHAQRAGDGDGANLLLHRRHHLAKLLPDGGVDGAGEQPHKPLDGAKRRVQPKLAVADRRCVAAGVAQALKVPDGPCA